MTDNIAILEGYTIEVMAEYHDRDVFILVKPNTDFSGTFRAWKMDDQEFAQIDGGQCKIKTEI